jgi:ribonuclease HI
MDMIYATIPVFGGEMSKIYRETKLAYIVSDPKHPNNYLVYSKDQDLGCFTLSINDELEYCTEIVNSSLNENNPEEGMLKMYFYGASSWEGDGEGILLISLSGKLFPFSFRLQFETNSMNNVCEYEALVLGLKVSKKMKIVFIIVCGDAKLILKQIKKCYQDKHPRMRYCINYAWDLIENLFLTFNIHVIPRQENKQVDSLVVATSTFQPPEVSNLKYEIEIKYKSSIPDNFKHWKVFEDEQQIKKVFRND